MLFTFYFYQGVLGKRDICVVEEVLGSRTGQVGTDCRLPIYQSPNRHLQRRQCFSMKILNFNRIGILFFFRKAPIHFVEIISYEHPFIYICNLVHLIFLGMPLIGKCHKAMYKFCSMGPLSTLWYIYEKIVVGTFWFLMKKF